MKYFLYFIISQNFENLDNSIFCVGKSKNVKIFLKNIKYFNSLLYSDINNSKNRKQMSLINYSQLSKNKNPLNSNKTQK